MPEQTLAQLKVGQSATVVDVSGDAVLEQRIVEMGVVPGVMVQVVRFAPLGDPVEIKVMGYSLSLRKSEAACVRVELLP